LGKLGIQSDEVEEGEIAVSGNGVV